MGTSVHADGGGDYIEVVGNPSSAVFCISTALHPRTLCIIVILS